MEDAIKKANEKITYLASDEDAIRLYEMREKAMFDYTSGINHARREGLSEGISQGIAQGIAQGKNTQSIEIAKNALKKGLSAETIHSITGLDETTINQLREELSLQPNDR